MIVVTKRKPCNNDLLLSVTQGVSIHYFIIFPIIMSLLQRGLLLPIILVSRTSWCPDCESWNGHTQHISFITWSKRQAFCVGEGSSTTTFALKSLASMTQKIRWTSDEENFQVELNCIKDGENCQSNAPKVEWYPALNRPQSPDL